MKKKWFRIVPLIVVTGALGILAYSGIVMLLWNSIVPAVFHLGAITLLQAIGLIALTRLLAGGFRRRRRFAYACIGRKQFEGRQFAGCRRMNPVTPGNE